MPWLGAAIGGVAGILGSELTNNQSQSNTAQTNATSIDLANTAFQRRVSDLKAAGLSPTLAYSQGGAAVPSLQTAQLQNLGSAATSGMAAGEGAQQAGQEAQVSKAQLANVPKQGDLMTAQTAAAQGAAQSSAADARLKDAQARAVDSTIGLQSSQSGQAQSQTLVNMNSASNLQSQSDLLRAQMEEVNKRIAQLGVQTQGMQISNDQARQLQPLIVQAKQLENKASQLGMPKLQAEANAWNRNIMQKYGGLLGPAKDATSIFSNSAAGAVMLMR